ncbi:activated RNA polymerase II transcriptional coactivator p15 isoform X1 [Spea bombifrons]|uniref:activated RNA polymerase II transcriptional coactivator p15 isoform X1 n=2 Tax=Spea bombifrons TaxID=233779 RepID=UPI00234B200E|nr:activated RNA polymerase II transcriptional coactivator p15 isoform X1 [Spea bombifrons]
MPRLSTATRLKVVILHKQGLSQAEVSRQTGVSRCAVQALLKKHKETGDVEDRGRSGRPRKLSAADERHIMLTSLCNWKLSSSAISSALAENSGTLVHPSTVRRSLVRSVLHGRLAAENMPKTKELVSSSSSGSDSDSEVDQKPKRKSQPPPEKEKPAKKQKTGESSKGAASSKQSGGNKDDNMFQIGKMRYVNVRDFKGKVLIDIREYWMTPEGDMKPGKKGISLNPEQWNQLKEQMSDIDDAIRRL